jgi:mannose-1-phosphate guanylyltransferase
MTHAAVILAGGPGTRLWPLSRRARPKQLLRLIHGRSLLAEAVDRLGRLLPPERIHVIALADHLPAIAAEVPALPAANLIGEPTPRDTAAAIALGSAILHDHDADTVMGVFTADHVIRPADRFVEIVRRGYAIAGQNPDALVTFGIRPSQPHTGMGYLQRGPPAGPGVWQVAAFREKPDAATARAYVDSGEYLWNSGMFAWRTSAILQELDRQLPQTAAAARRIAAGRASPDGARLAAELYPGLRRISIDYAVMEHARRVLMLEMDVEWADVGSWSALATVLGPDSEGNVRGLPQSVVLQGRNNILIGEDRHLIALVGVDDLVVVHSPDATLICRRGDEQRIKELVAELERMHGQTYL